MLSKIPKGGPGDKLVPGIHAIVPLHSKLESNIMDIVLFYWPIEGRTINIDRDNPTSLFLRVLHEISSTVCIPVTIKEVEDFGTKKVFENDKSHGIAIRVKRVTDAKNDITWEEKQHLNLVLTKEDVKFDTFKNKYNNDCYDAIDDNLTPYEIFALNGHNNTIKLCLKYDVGKRIISQSQKMTFANKDAAIKYFQEKCQSHRILWDEDVCFQQLDVLVSNFIPLSQQVT